MAVLAAVKVWSVLAEKHILGTITLQFQTSPPTQGGASAGRLEGPIPPVQGDRRGVKII